MSKKKKTREQKIISELRRKLSVKEVNQPREKIQQIVSKPQPLKNIPITTTSSGNTPVITLQNNYSYVFNDLKKLSLLIGLAILLQGVLYLALR